MAADPDFEQMGNIVVQIFTEKGTGAKRQRQLAALVKTIFVSQRFNGIVCREAIENRVGETGAHYQLNIEIEYFVHRVT